MRQGWQRWRQWSSATPNRRIFSGAVIIGVVTVVAKLIAVAKELAIAAYFGRSDQVEAYLLAILLPFFIGNIIGVSFLGAAVPALARTEAESGRQASDRLFSGLLLVAIVSLTVIASGMIVVRDQILPLMTGGFAPDKFALTQELYLIAVPIVMLGALSVMFTAAFHGRERFLFPALTPSLTPVTVLLAMTLVGSDVHWLVYAILIGQALEICVLVVALIAYGHRFSFPRPLIAHGLTSTVAQWWPAFIAAFMMAGNTIVEQITAAHLHAGSVAAFGYAQRLVMLPLMLVVSTVGAALLSVLSRSQTSMPLHEAIRVTDWWRRCVLWSAAIGTIVVLLTASWLTALLFERGNFTSVDTAVVAVAVAGIAMIAPWYLVGMLSIRQLNVLGGNHSLPAIAMVNLLLCIGGNLILAPRLGVLGIALTSVGVSFVFFLQTEWHLRRLRRKRINDHEHRLPSERSAGHAAHDPVL